MGEKAYCLYVNMGGDTLDKFPKHDRTLARQILYGLGLRDCSSIGMTSFEEAIYPRESNQLYLGAYEGSFLLCNMEITQDFFSGFDGTSEGVIDQQIVKAKIFDELSGNPSIWVKRVLDAYPKAVVDVVVMHSIINLWGYACFKSGKRVRTRAGSTDFGTVIEYGDMLSFEQELFSKQVIVNGERRFQLPAFGGKTELYADDEVGGDFVLKLIGQWFGDQKIRGPWFQGEARFNSDNLELESFDWLSRR